MTTFLSQTPFTVHHLFIVDTALNSKRAIKDLVAQVNDSLDAIRQAARKNTKVGHRITMMILEKGQLKCAQHDLPVSDLPHYLHHTNSYSGPRPILDAIGASIATWRVFRQHKKANDQHQVSIFTSGQDRGSRKYSICTLQTIITSLVSSGWRFTLIGTTPFLPRIANKLGITNYYLCKPPREARERNFLISQLKRQWLAQQNRPNQSTTSVAA